MPRRDDINKILLIGSGPIVIGQAAEFDYSGVQACKVLLEDGYEVVLVNSNPATIMTDPEFAHRTYVEPLLPESVARIIERERPDALLPTLGGQTALNLAKALHDDGTLQRLGVELIGADYDAIHRAEDREAFRRTIEGAGLRVPWSMIVDSIGDAERGLTDGTLQLPAIVRPAFTLGGHGGGVGKTATELLGVVSEGLAASPINQVLVEESVLGWGEFELEVMRDRNDNVVIICSIENVDPMGVHTGDSVTVAPAQTLTDDLYQELRDQAIRVIRAVGRGDRRLEHPIRRQPRERRDRGDRDEPTRLALVGAGLEGDRLPDREDRREARRRLRARGDRQRHHRASPRPRSSRRSTTSSPRCRGSRSRSSPGAEGELTTHMKSVGEAMAIGRTFRESFAKAMRSRELDSEAEPPREDEALLELLGTPRADRFDLVDAAFRRGLSVEQVHERTSIDPWFLRELQALATEGDGTDGARPHLPLGGHLRRRVRGEDALLLLAPTSARRRSRARSAAATAIRWSSWARARTGSGRGSSSTTAACTRR